MFDDFKKRIKKEVLKEKNLKKHVKYVENIRRIEMKRKLLKCLKKKLKKSSQNKIESVNNEKIQYLIK